MNYDAKLFQRLSLLSILAAVILFGYFFARFLLGGTILVDMQGVDMDTSQLLLDNEALGFFGHNEQAQETRLVNIFGSKKLTIYSAGYRPYETTISLYVRGTKNIKPALEESPAQEEAQKLAGDLGLPGNYQVTDARYEKNASGDITFLVFRTSTNPDEPEVYASFNLNNGSWEQVVVGDD